MKARRSTAPRKISQFHERALEITLEMLKMKVDPAMCMKTKAKRQNVHPFQPAFCTKMHGFRNNRGEFCQFLQKIGVFLVERPGNCSPCSAAGRDPSLLLRMTARREGPTAELLRDTLLQIGYRRIQART